MTVGINEAWALQLAYDNGKIKPSALYLAEDLLNRFVGEHKGGDWENIKGGQMSDKQIALMVRLVEEGAAFHSGADLMTTTASVANPAQAGSYNVAGIKELFDVAGLKLKWPKISFALADKGGPQIDLSKASASGKNPGCLYVKVGATYVGKINTYGAFIAVPKVDPGLVQQVLQALQALSHDPVGVAAAYGKLTGHCCFCSTPLKTKESLEVGYGPVCADAYHLPWGAKGFGKLAQIQAKYEAQKAKLKTKADLAMADLAADLDAIQAGTLTAEAMIDAKKAMDNAAQKVWPPGASGSTLLPNGAWTMPPIKLKQPHADELTVGAIKAVAKGFKHSPLGKVYDLKELRQRLVDQGLAGSLWQATQVLAAINNPQNVSFQEVQVDAPTLIGMDFGEAEQTVIAHYATNKAMAAKLGKAEFKALYEGKPMPEPIEWEHATTYKGMPISKAAYKAMWTHTDSSKLGFTAAVQEAETMMTYSEEHKGWVLKTQVEDDAAIDPETPLDPHAQTA